MQADMEIQSAAKLPNRHLRPAGGTGARSALKSLLSLSSANCAVVNSLCKFMPKFPASSKVNHHQQSDQIKRLAIRTGASHRYYRPSSPQMGAMSSIKSWAERSKTPEIFWPTPVFLFRDNPTLPVSIVRLTQTRPPALKNAALLPLLCAA